MGRKTLLTEEVAEQITTALKAGAYLEDAANYAGVGTSTVHEWIARGLGTDPHRPPTPEFTEFAEAVEQARAAARLEHVLLIRQAARAGQWQASAWFLERTEPGKWGRKDRVEIGGDPAAPLVIQTRPVPDEARLAQIFKALEDAGLTAPLLLPAAEVQDVEVIREADG